MTDASTLEIIQAQETARESSLVFAFLMGSDKVRLLKLVYNIENACTQGQY